MPSADAGGLLIVNADDYGIDRTTSAAILACLEAGTITSATAMVWMSDSESAAERFPADPARLGLHLNLIEPYTADGVPPAARERQARLAAYFRRTPLSRWLYNPAIAGRVNDCIDDQLDAFRELYRLEPTHVDGHQHYHLAPNVLLSRSLAAVPKLRPGFTFSAGEKGAANRAYRRALNGLIGRRFRTPRNFHSIRTLAPDLGGVGCQRVEEAARTSIEVMTHPGWEDELRYLASDEWRSCLEGVPLGSYAEL